MALQFSFKHLKAPTPKVLKRLGNAMIAVSTSAAIPVGMQSNKWVGIGMVVVSLIGRFLCEFFTDTDEKAS